DRVLHRLADRPLAWRRFAIEQRVGHRQEEPAQIAKGALREREDAIGLVRGRRRDDERGLLLHEDVEEGVAQIGGALARPGPIALEIGVAQTRERAERCLERHFTRASMGDRRSINLRSAWLASRPAP